MSKDAAVARIAARQHGLVTRDQARACGLTDDEIHYRLAGGRWSILRRTVFVINGCPPGWEQAVRGACLATGDVCAAAGLTAGRLWELRLPPPAEIELVSPLGRRHRLEGVRHHRRTDLDVADFGQCRGIPSTSPARTLVDTSGLVVPGNLGKVVDDALRRKVLTMGELRSCHERIDAGPGRRATVAMRQVLAERQPGYDPGDSDRELWVIDVLVKAGLRAPVQQHRVRVGGHIYYLDLAYLPEMVGLEFDGWDTHRTFSSFHGDRQRTRRLVAAGWTILPVTARTRPAELVGDVAAALALSGQLRGA